MKFYNKLYAIFFFLFLEGIVYDMTTLKRRNFNTQKHYEISKPSCYCLEFAMESEPAIDRRPDRVYLEKCNIEI